MRKLLLLLVILNVVYFFRAMQPGEQESGQKIYERNELRYHRREMVDFLTTALLTVQLVRAEVFGVDDDPIGTSLKSIVDEKNRQLNMHIEYLAEHEWHGLGSYGIPEGTEIFGRKLRIVDLGKAEYALWDWKTQLNTIFVQARDRGETSVQTPPLCVYTWLLLPPMSVTLNRVSNVDISEKAMSQYLHVALLRVKELGLTDSQPWCNPL